MANIIVRENPRSSDRQSDAFAAYGGIPSEGGKTIRLRQSTFVFGYGGCPLKLNMKIIQRRRADYATPPESLNCKNAKN
jgi:hypothetical protein